MNVGVTERVEARAIYPALPEHPPCCTASGAVDFTVNKMT